MVEHQQTLGQWLGEIQSNGGLFVLGVIFVVLGIAFWIYAALIVKGLKEDIAAGERRAVDRIYLHQLHWHLDNGDPIKMELDKMLEKYKEPKP
jgi:hypothetical protein